MKSPKKESCFVIRSNQPSIEKPPSLHSLTRVEIDWLVWFGEKLELVITMTNELSICCLPLGEGESRLGMMEFIMFLCGVEDFLTKDLVKLY